MPYAVRLKDVDKEAARIALEGEWRSPVVEVERGGQHHRKDLSVFLTGSARQIRLRGLEAIQRPGKKHPVPVVTLSLSCLNHTVEFGLDTLAHAA